MPRYVIPRKNLPPINPYTNSYQVRYRLISENQNRLSAWSPIFDVSPEVEYTSSEANVTHSGRVVTCVWFPYPNVDEYSVWIAWDNGLDDTTWIHYGETSLTSIVTETPLGVNKFSIRVYKSFLEVDQYDSALLDRLKLYERLNRTV